MEYKTKGVCAKHIYLDVEGGVIKTVSFEGGCQGNLVGLSRLVVGMKPTEAAETLKGIRCGPRSTSCPDQLALALTDWMEQQKV